MIVFALGPAHVEGLATACEKRQADKLGRLKRGNKPRVIKKEGKEKGEEAEVNDRGDAKGEKGQLDEGRGTNGQKRGFELDSGNAVREITKQSSKRQQGGAGAQQRK